MWSGLIIVFFFSSTASAFNIFTERVEGVPSTPSVHKSPRYFTFDDEDIFNSEEYQRELQRQRVAPFKDPIENKTYLNTKKSRAKIAAQKAKASAGAAKKLVRAVAPKTKSKRSPVSRVSFKRKFVQRAQQNNVPVKKAQWR